MTPDSVWLAPAQRWTTRAGFGCAGLMGALSRRESLALLETAWDAGARHFDVAPVYGHGEAEYVLGTFLRGRRDQVTLVTKYGLEPTGNSTALRIARAVARPFARQLRALRPAGKHGAAFAPSAAVPLTAAGAQRSLERSLRALQTEYVDAFLLHEPTVARLTDDGLHGFLEQAVQRGLIRSFGIGGDRRHVSEVFASHQRYCPMVQCEWSVFVAEPPLFPGSQLSVFGVLSELRREADVAGFGIESGADAARLALRAAALALPGSLILFSSRNRAHVGSSFTAVSDTTLDSAALQLLALVRERHGKATIS
jgi:diketogulonate reductase-like aldo/keto reductase